LYFFAYKPSILIARVNVLLMADLCFSVIHISPSKVWCPDIMVYNSVEHYDYETTDLILVNTGEVRA
jgi:hypothetical protein